MPTIAPLRSVLLGPPGASTRPMEVTPSPAGRLNGSGPTEFHTASFWDRHVESLSVAIFISSFVLRLALALVNRYANDDHIEVVELMIATGRIPGPSECFECFQPKLYHVLILGLSSLLGLTGRTALTVSGQVVNAIAAGAFIWLIARFVMSAPAAAHVRLGVLAVFALNPSFIGISGQSTNDTLTIVLAGSSALALVRSLTGRPLFWQTIAGLLALLAGLTKGNGLVAGVAVGCWLGARVWLLLGDRRQARRQAAVLAAFVLAYLVIVPFGGAYATNYQVSGSPFAINVPREPPPLLWERTVAQRPGITSVVGSYLTFPLVDLLETPFIVDGSDPPPQRHRESLWTQLYGRWHFAQFPSWPPPWHTSSRAVLAIARIDFVLGLVQIALILCGMVVASWSVYRGIRLRPADATAVGRHLILGIFIVMYAGFIVKYTYDYRDYPVMKDVFIMPAIPCTVHAMIVGWGWLDERSGPAMRWALFAASGFLSLGYVVSLIPLMVSLALR